MRQGFIAHRRHFEGTVGIQWRDTQIPLPLDGLATQSRQQGVIAVLPFPLPGGEVVQCQIQRGNPKLCHFLLGEVPEQHFAAVQRNLTKIEPGWAGFLGLRGRGLFLNGLRIGRLPVPGKINAVILQEVYPNVRLVQLNGFKTGNSANQLEKIHVHHEPVKANHLLALRIGRRQSQSFYPKGKGIGTDIGDFCLPAHTLVQLLWHQPLQPPGKQQEPCQGVQNQKRQESDQQIPGHATAFTALGHRHLLITGGFPGQSCPPACSQG